MPVIRNVVVKMEGDNSGLQRAARSSMRLLADLGKAGKQLALLGGAAAGAAVAGLAVLGKQSAENIDRLQKLSSNLGTTARQTQQLELVADLTGVGMDSLGRGMQRLNREVGKLKIGRASKETAVAFEQLGLSMEALEGNSPVELLQLVTQQLGKIQDPTKRQALGFILMGKAAAQMNPLIAEGAAIFQQTDDLMRSLGLGLGNNAKQVEKLNDTWATLQFIGVALRDQVFAALLPLLQQSVQALINVASEFIKSAGGAEALAQIIKGAVIENVRAAIDWFSGFLDIIKSVGEAIGFVIRVIKGIGRVGGALLAGTASLFRGEFSGANRILSESLVDVFKGDEEDKEEAKKQTELLKQLVAKSGAAFG